jgi:hypothetical protein
MPVITTDASRCSPVVYAAPTSASTTCANASNASTSKPYPHETRPSCNSAKPSPQQSLPTSSASPQALPNAGPNSQPATAPTTQPSAPTRPRHPTQTATVLTPPYGLRLYEDHPMPLPNKKRRRNTWPTNTPISASQALSCLSVARRAGLGDSVDFGPRYARIKSHRAPSWKPLAKPTHLAQARGTSPETIPGTITNIRLTSVRTVRIVKRRVGISMSRNHSAQAQRNSGVHGEVLGADEAWVRVVDPSHPLSASQSSSGFQSNESTGQLKHHALRRPWAGEQPVSDTDSYTGSTFSNDDATIRVEDLDRSHEQGHVIDLRASWLDGVPSQSTIARSSDASLRSPVRHQEHRQALARPPQSTTGPAFCFRATRSRTVLLVRFLAP